MKTEQITISEKQYLWNRLYTKIYEFLLNENKYYTKKEMASVLYEIAQDLELDENEKEVLKQQK